MLKFVFSESRSQLKMEEFTRITHVQSSVFSRHNVSQRLEFHCRRILRESVLQSTIFHFSQTTTYPFWSLEKGNLHFAVYWQAEIHPTATIADLITRL